MKDIRRLVDNGEFLANKHCKNSPVVKLIITLLLELITDHSREVTTSSPYIISVQAELLEAVVMSLFYKAKNHALIIAGQYCGKKQMWI